MRSANSFRTHRDDAQIFLEGRFAGQRHYIPLVEAGKNFDLGRIWDAHFDKYAVEAVLLNSIDESLVALDKNSPARNHKGPRPFADMNSHVNGCVGKQVQPVIGYRADQFPDVPRSPGDHLLWQHLCFAIPDPVRMRVPENLDGLVDVNLPQLWLIDKRPDPHLVQVRQLGQEVADLHEIALTNRERIQRAVAGSAAVSRLQPLLEIANGPARVFHQHC